jgi:transposase-like protein
MSRRDFPDEFKADAIRLVAEQRYFFAQAWDALSGVVSYLLMWLP